MNIDKQKIHDFWNKASCGENLYLTKTDQVGYDTQVKTRYDSKGKLIFSFIRFTEAKGIGDA